MKVLVAVVGVGMLGVSCSAGGEDRTDRPPTTSSAAMEVSAGQLAKRIGCENQVREALGGFEGGEPAPVDNVHCNVGDAQMSVRTYGNEGEVLRALQAHDRACGFRLVGDRWMVVVNTLGTATALQQRIGGRVVTLSGCTPR